MTDDWDRRDAGLASFAWNVVAILGGDVGLCQAFEETAFGGRQSGQHIPGVSEAFKVRGIQVSPPLPSKGVFGEIGVNDFDIFQHFFRIHLKRVRN